jgi:hypothetical protein
MSLGSFLKEPLQGKTSLSKVFWLYGVLGSVLVSAFGVAVDPGNELATRMYTVFGLLFSVYVTVATYQCASNCRSKFLARMVRISAVISLLALPVVAYLYFSGAIGVALATLAGEQ